MSSVEVACFVLVFGPLLLPVALLLGLRMAFCFGMLFLQVHVQIPPFVKLLALGLIGQVMLLLNFVRAAVAKHLQFLRHPISLALGFPPALLLTLVKGRIPSPAKRTESGDMQPLFVRGETAKILEAAASLQPAAH